MEIDLLIKHCFKGIVLHKQLFVYNNISKDMNKDNLLFLWFLVFAFWIYFQRTIYFI